MFIPAQTPDLQLPLTQLLETKPVVPVTAAPGIPEDAQHLDSRVALQWAQPVLPAEKGQSARTSLAVPLAVQIVKPLNIKGFEPQGPDPDALQKGEVHPMLAEGLASWIKAVASKPTPIIQTKPNTLKQTVANQLATPDRVEEVNEATPNQTALKLVDLSVMQGNPVMPALLSMYESLARSDIFAAQRLAESWLPRRVKLHEEEPASNSSEKTNTDKSSNSQETKAPDVHPSQAKMKSGDLLDKFTEMARPSSNPTTEQLTKWVAALEPDSSPAQQAAHMLTQGQMVWMADLAPGVPMRMIREDAWRNDANRPAQLEKGAMLQVELNLPRLGRIRVVGSQWGQDISLQIAHDAISQDQWMALAPSLLSDLQAQGIDDVRLETLPSQDEVSNG